MSGAQARTSLEVEAQRAEFFSNAQNCHFEQVNITVNHGAENRDLDALLNPILDASHTRNRRTAPPDSKCFAGTRQSVLQDIRTWVDSSLTRNTAHVMWVYGFAGCGKSAIAQQIAEDYAGLKRLAASFFFFRGSGDRSRLARFARSIAWQVAATIPATAPRVKEALSANTSLLTTATSVSAQFQHLVYEPIKAARWHRVAASLLNRPFLIVIDGIDECEDREEVASFMEHMTEFFKTKPRFPLRFLITSRVEDHIHQQLHSSAQVQLFDLVNYTSDADISTALDAAIAIEKRSRLFAACGDAWPSQEEKEKLVKHIGGSFIFMTTILRYLFDRSGDDGLNPITRLPLALNMNPGFDVLYTSILERSERLPHFFDIVRTIALTFAPLSIVQLADLLAIERVEVVAVLINMQAIVQVPGDDRTPIALWHTSFRDFLCSEDRSGRFFATPKHHRLLLYKCISLGGLTFTFSSQASGYCSNFVGRHCEGFLKAMKTDTTALVSELDAIIGHLEMNLATQFKDVATTYFSIKRMWNSPTYQKPFTTRLQITSIINQLYGREIPHHLISVVTRILEGFLAIPGEAALEKGLVAHLRSLHPHWFDPAHHLAIVTRGIDFFVGLSGTGHVLIHSGQGLPFWDTHAYHYILTRWSWHLAWAIRNDPRHPIFDRAHQIQIRCTQTTKAGKYHYRASSVSEMASNLSLAQLCYWQAGAPYTDVCQWYWDEQGRFVLRDGTTRSLTVYDVLQGLKSLHSCYAATCWHAEYSSRMSGERQCRYVCDPEMTIGAVTCNTQT